MAKSKKQDSSISGWLLVWVIATILLMIFNLIGNFTNPVGWIVNILLLVVLIMVFNGKGTRWLMVIVGIIFGGIFLYSAVTVTPSSMCFTNWKACMAMGTARDEILLAMAQRALIGGVILSIYMFTSSIYFAMSKRIKARFGKKS